ncbi:MAG: hypothetical protein BWK78_00105 [Thiotrichaceae bacterium IS1]|nr:MAG: hypothetical protein BWK78_00105 [Thiotrichaceae bacterium IS1]
MACLVVLFLSILSEVAVADKISIGVVLSKDNPEYAGIEQAVKESKKIFILKTEAKYSPKCDDIEQLLKELNEAKAKVLIFNGEGAHCIITPDQKALLVLLPTTKDADHQKHEPQMVVLPSSFPMKKGYIEEMKEKIQSSGRAACKSYKPYFITTILLKAITILLDEKADLDSIKVKVREKLQQFKVVRVPLAPFYKDSGNTEKPDDLLEKGIPVLEDRTEQSGSLIKVKLLENTKKFKLGDQVWIHKELVVNFFPSPEK